MIRNFRVGFSTFFSGLKKCLTTPGLLKIAILPMILNAVCFFSVLVLALKRVPEIAAWLVTKPEIWYQYALYYLTMLIAAFTLIFLSIFVVWIIGGLFSFPFYDLLSEKVLRSHGLLPERPGGFKTWLKQSLHNFKTMLKKTFFLVIVAAILFVSTLIPGLGVVGVILGVLMMTFDILDYSFDHFGWTLGERLKFCRINGLAFLGFAFALALTTLLPVLSILLMPGLVVAGSQLIANLTKPQIKS